MSRTITIDQFCQIFKAGLQTDYIAALVSMREDGLITEANMKTMLLSIASKCNNDEKLNR